MIDLRCLGIVLSCCACTPTSPSDMQRDEQRPAPPTEQPTTAAVEPPEPAAPEQQPAPPCSVAGMLLRDTPITTFEHRCPRTLLPPEGEIARCFADAIAAERPFVSELVMPKPMPPYQHPLVVGAMFNGHYEVRMYQQNERIKLVFGQLEPGKELGFSVDPERLRCVQSPELPNHPRADQWQTVGHHAGHRFAPDACVEWFDGRPRVSRFDRAISLVCTAHLPEPPEQPPAPEQPKVEVDPVSASACEAGDGPACVAAAISVAPTGAFRVYLTEEEADRRVDETVRYAALGCELDQAQGCAIWGRFGPWRERDVAYGRACELGHACSCAHLGESLTALRKPKDDLLRGLDLLGQACVAGHRDDRQAPDYSLAHAPGQLCHRAASLHGFGRESMLEPNPTKAAKYHRLACEQGYVLGCPCERDEDCGGEPYYCLESTAGGSCVQPSDCGPDPDDDDDDGTDGSQPGE